MVKHADEFHIIVKEKKMNLLQDLRTALMQARKRKDHDRICALSTVVGESESLMFRQKGEMTDQQVAKVIKGVIKGNEETISASPNHERVPKLIEEVEILESMLPQMWEKVVGRGR